MRKLYIAVAAFAALTVSQIGHAIPTIPGATDLATNDANTYYALQASDSGWFVNGYNANGNSNGFSVQLSPSAAITPDLQHYVGLAYDGSTFYVLKDDSITTAASGGHDTWTVITFNMDGSWDGNHLRLGPSEYVAPSQQNYVGLSIAEEGLFALLENDAADTYYNVGFDVETGAWNGFAEELGDNPSSTVINNMAAFNNSPVQFEYTNSNGKVASVPEPGTGLLLGSMLALGLVGRKRLRK